MIPSYYPPPQNSILEDFGLTYQCPNCSSMDTVEDDRTGDCVCSECGTVLGERLVDFCADWKPLSDDDRAGGKQSQSRVNTFSPQTLAPAPSSAVSAHIKSCPEKEDQSSSQDDDEETSISSPARIANKEKRLREVYERITDWVGACHGPDTVTELAQQYYLQFESRKKPTGRYDKEAAAGAVVYIAFKELKFPRTFKELARARGTATEAQLKRTFKWLSTLLGVSFSIASASVSAAIAPKDLVLGICSNLALPQFMQSFAMDAAENSAPLLEGKSPISIAATCIFFVGSYLPKHPSAVEVAKAAKISPTTVYTIVKILQTNSIVVLPLDFFTRIQKHVATEALKSPTKSSASSIVSTPRAGCVTPKRVIPPWIDNPKSQ